MIKRFHFALYNALVVARISERNKMTNCVILTRNVLMVNVLEKRR